MAFSPAAGPIGQALGETNHMQRILGFGIRYCFPDLSHTGDICLASEVALHDVVRDSHIGPCLLYAETFPGASSLRSDAFADTMTAHLHLAEKVPR